MKRETYRGVRLAVRQDRPAGRVVGSINGCVVLAWLGSDVERAAQSLRGTVDHFNESPESYTNGYGDVSYGMTREVSR